jgi:hypothetical protein
MCNSVGIAWDTGFLYPQSGKKLLTRRKQMAKKNLWLGILAISLVFGMAVVGCDTDGTTDDGIIAGGTDTTLNGKWAFLTTGGYTIERVFNNGKWNSNYLNSTNSKGTYSTNEGQITEKTTDIYGKSTGTVLALYSLYLYSDSEAFKLEDRWYPFDEFKNAVLATGITEERFNIYFRSDPVTSLYSINGDTLTVTTTATVFTERETDLFSFYPDGIVGDYVYTYVGNWTTTLGKTIYIYSYTYTSSTTYTRIRDNALISLNGTWGWSVESGGTSITLKLIFNNGNFEYYANGNPYMKGTYTPTNDSMTIRIRDSMTMTITHLGGTNAPALLIFELDSQTWYSRDEIKAAYLKTHPYTTSLDLENMLDRAFSTDTVTYSLLSDQLFYVNVVYTKE